LKKTDSITAGIAFAIAGVVLFSSKAVMVKLAYAYAIDSITLLFFRMLFAVPIYVAIVFRKTNKTKNSVTFKDYLWVVAFGVLGYYLASLFDFIGLNYIKAGLERIILFCYPTLVVLFSWLFFRRKPNRAQLFAIVITYMGIALIFWTEIGVSGATVLWGGFLVFLSAVTYALYLVGSGWLIPKFGVLKFTSYAMIVASCCVFIHYGFTGNKALMDFPWEVYALGFAMAIFATVLPSFLVSAAIAKLGASTFSIFGSIGPISTLLLAFVFLNEEITLVQILGMIVVLVGVSLVSKKESA